MTERRYGGYTLEELTEMLADGTRPMEAVPDLVARVRALEEGLARAVRTIESLLDADEDDKYRNTVDWDAAFANARGDLDAARVLLASGTEEQ